MTAYEHCMKVGVMLNPPTLNRWPQEGQGMWGHKREDHMIDMGKAHNCCGEWNGKGADKPKKGEGIGRGKLRGWEWWVDG
jgi:hypothetical protein